MDKMKYTPGPWSEYFGDYSIEIFALDDNQSYVANVNKENEKSEYNSHLIHASPDLLESLIELSSAVELYAKGNIETMEYFMFELEKAKKAIANATSTEQ